MITDAECRRALTMLLHQFGGRLTINGQHVRAFEMNMGSTRSSVEACRYNITGDIELTLHRHGEHDIGEVRLTEVPALPASWKVREEGR